MTSTHESVVGYLAKSLQTRYRELDSRTAVGLVEPLVADVATFQKRHGLTRLSQVGVRLEETAGVTSAQLCNHGGPDGCDCGEHKAPASVVADAENSPLGNPAAV